MKFRSLALATCVAVVLLAASAGDVQGRTALAPDEFARLKAGAQDPDAEVQAEWDAA